MKKIEIFEKIVTGHFLLDKIRLQEFTKYVDGFFQFCYEMKHFPASAEAEANAKSLT